MLFTQKRQSTMHIHLASSHRTAGMREETPHASEAGKCHYPAWNPAKPLFSCPLGSAQQLRKEIQTRIFESLGQTPLGGCSQVPLAAPNPSDTRLQTGSIPTSGGPQPHGRGERSFQHLGTQSSEEVVPRAQGHQRQQLSSGPARAALGHSARSRSAGSPRGPQSWSPSIQIHRHTSLAWLLPRSEGRCLVAAG